MQCFQLVRGARISQLCGDARFTCTEVQAGDLFQYYACSSDATNIGGAGYTRYCRGWFVAIPAFSGWSHRADVRAVAPDVLRDEKLRASEVELLSAHASYGCISLTCDSANQRCPFVFVPRRKFGLVPFVYLAYCRDIADFVRFAGPLGRFLARRGFPLVVLDSNGPIRGVTGMYFDTRPKYFKGPHQPRLGDLAYSELAMFFVGSS